MNTDVPADKLVRGVVTFRDTSGNVLASFENQLQYDWAKIASQCIGFGNRAYRISGMYVEYENVTTPSDVVSVPAYVRADGTSYYSGLSSSGVRDYLRLPLASLPKPGVSAGLTGYFGVDPAVGNTLDFYAITSGTAGVTGKAFTVAVNSKICGVGLIATPSWTDLTQDLLFARAYVPTGNQLVVPAGSQIAITWTTSFL